MGKRILLVIAILLFVVSFALADEGGPVKQDVLDVQENKLGVTLDLTYTSKWLSKGVEAYGPHGGLFKTIDVDFYDTGFGLKVTHRNATSSGHVDKERFDFRPYYKGSLFDDKSYKIKYNLSVGYESYTDLSRHKANTTYEWIGSFAFPKLFSNGLVPCYVFHYEHPASGGDSNRKLSGAVHRFLLGYDLNLQELPSPLKLSTEIAYYDGLGGKVSDWGYSNIGLSTKFQITENLSFVPSIYHQLTMDDNISKHKDITYTMLSMRYKF